MEADIIDRMRREGAELTRKLEAVRALLSAYGEVIIRPPVARAGELPKSVVTQPKAPRSREKIPVERFSVYGQEVIKAAFDECKKHLGIPIPSRRMVELVEARGIIVRGVDKGNAISALLARSSDLKPNGRKGWTLSDEFDRSSYLGLKNPKENEPSSEIAVGSDTGEEGAPTPTDPWSNPQSGRAS